MAAEKVLKVRFLAEHECRQPEARLNVQAPAVEVQIETVQPGNRRVDAIEAHDGESFVLHPDAPFEAALARFRQRRQVKYQAANFSQEFTAHVVELVMLAVEAAGIQID